MTITAQLVKELRIKSSAGMMDCKKALTETNGDMDAAIDWLRKKGLATASKKSGRIASEGLVGVFVDNTSGSIVEINSETDFVARNIEFQNFVKSIAKIANDVGNNSKTILGSVYPNSDKKVEEILTEKIAKIGENMTFRRVDRLEVSAGLVSSYIHNSVDENLGKIGVLIAIESDGEKDKISKLGKQLAMHIAATSPSSIAIEDLSPDLVERERAVLIDQAVSAGKPEDIAKKMVEGRLRKFYSEVVFLEQIFVLDGETKVADAIAKISKEIGKDIKIKGFVRYNLGEGIEKDQKSFADEVANQLKN